jgi:hypothetical protein
VDRCSLNGGNTAQLALPLSNGLRVAGRAAESHRSLHPTPSHRRRPVRPLCSRQPDLGETTSAGDRAAALCLLFPSGTNARLNETTDNREESNTCRTRPGRPVTCSATCNRRTELVRNREQRLAESKRTIFRQACNSPKEGDRWSSRLSGHTPRPAVGIFLRAEDPADPRPHEHGESQPNGRRSPRARFKKGSGSKRGRESLPGSKRGRESLPERPEGCFAQRLPTPF